MMEMHGLTVRVEACHSKGCGFESRRFQFFQHQKIKLNYIMFKTDLSDWPQKSILDTDALFMCMGHKLESEPKSK